MLLNGNSALRRPGTLKRRCHSFLPKEALAASGACRQSLASGTRPGTDHWGAGFWRQALMEEPNAPFDIVLCGDFWSPLPTTQIRPISPIVVLYLMLRCGTGDDRMASAA